MKMTHDVNFLWITPGRRAMNVKELRTGRKRTVPLISSQLRAPSPLSPPSLLSSPAPSSSHHHPPRKNKDTDNQQQPTTTNTQPTHNQHTATHSHNNKQQTTNSKQQTTNNKQQTTNNKQQTTNNKQQTTNNKQQTTNNKQQTTNNKQQTTNNNNTPPGAGHRVVVEGLSSQSVRPLRGLTAEARSRPGVTVAGGPTCTEDTATNIFLVWGSSPTPRWPRHGDRLLAGPVDAEPGDLGGQGQGGFWLRQEAAGGRGGGWVAAVVVGRGGAGCVSCCVCFLRRGGRCPCCADR